MTTPQQQFIEFALAQQALRFGQFELKSGRQSPYFFNAGAFTQGEGIAQLGHYYAKTLTNSPLTFDMLFGTAYKGIPLATTTAMALATEFGRNVPFAFNRKEPKDHGEGGQLVGAPLQGQRVVLIDDVITAGTAVREVKPLLEQAGATLVGILIALDRQERGQGNLSTISELENEFGVHILSIIRFTDLVTYLKGLPDYAQHLATMQNYWRSMWDA
jgi:orotate phosphoribosyltransferase